MPRLEIHDADGNVTYLQLSQDTPVLIGSGPNCDVVLKSAEVKRVHCRIVWRDDRWRVEVASDVRGVKLRDKTVQAATVRPGDIIGIGKCRIYMDEDAALARSRASAEASPYSSDLFREGAGSLTGSESGERMLDRGSIRKVEHLHDQRNFLLKTWDWIRSKAKEQVRGEMDRPPGQERVLGSPLVRWMAVAVAIIAVLGGYFFLDWRERSIKGLFDKANSTMNEGNWEGAIRLYDSFLDSYPKHDLASNARVKRALCEVENATSPALALDTLQKMLREQSKERAFPKIAEGLAPIAARIAQSLGESARDKANQRDREGAQKAYQLAESAEDLLSKGFPRSDLSADARDKLIQTMEQARAAIKKTDERLAAIETMDQAMAMKNTADAYRARERLVQLYADLSEDVDIRERLDRANKLDRDVVRFDDTSSPALTEPRDGALATSMLLLDRNGPIDGAAAATGDVVFSLAGGVSNAHDIATGKVVWSRVVGIDARELPLAIPGGPEPAVLLSDTRHDELVAVRRPTGQLVWRQPLGEPLEAPPLIHRGRIYQPTGAGNLVVMDAASGRVDGRLQFAPQRLTSTPVSDDSGQYLYLLGEQNMLYVVALGNPPRCHAAYYLAQRPDSIIAAPLRMGRYLVLCENNSVNQCQIRVLLLATDGTLDREIQRPQPPLNGWVHRTPTVWGNLMFVATDRETVEVFSAGPPEKEEGFTRVTSAAAGTPAGPRGQAYPLAYTERDLLVAGTKVRHYDFKAEQQTLTPNAEKFEGAASQPIQRYPATGRIDTLFLAWRVPSSSAIAFTALDAATLDKRWDVLLGNGLLSLVPGDAAKNELLALARGGHLFRILAADLVSGGALDQPASRIESEVELSNEMEPVVLGDRSTVYTASGEASRLIICGPSTDLKTRRIDLPAPLEAPLAVFQGDLLAPTADGRLYWISAATGKQLAEPFQPPLVAGQLSQWRGVALTAQGNILAIDSGGTVYPLELRKEPSPHLSLRADPVKLPKPVRSRIAAIGNVVCCVDETNTLRALDAESLAPLGDWRLPAAASIGPVAVDGHVLVVAGHDAVVSINSQGQRAWQEELKGETVAGIPLVQADTIYLTMRSGLVRALRLSDGAELWRLEAEKPLASGLVPVGEMLVVAGDDGSLNVLRAPTAAN